MKFQFADRVRDIGTKKIREKMEVPSDYGLISFASGSPSSDLFPVEDAKNAAAEALAHWEKMALQYTPSAGMFSLRAKIAERMNRKFGTASSPHSICVTTGSQQAFDLLGKLFLNEGDVVLCEVPMQLSVIMAFSNYGVRFAEVATDDEGMIPEDVEAALRSEKNVKMVYICPDFMRSSGKSWSEERRKQFLEVVSGFDVLVVEDITTSEIRYEGSHAPAVASFDKNGQVVVVGSFSRIFCPGIRIGWIAAPEELFEGVNSIKRATDLSSSSLDQCALAQYMDMHDLDAHVEQLVAAYKRKRDLLDRAMRENFPKPAKFDKPEGEVFVWVRMENGLDAGKLLGKCIEQQVSFVPARQFFPNGGGENMFRLSFAALPMERIRAGVQRIVRGMGALGVHPSTRVDINPTSYLNLNETKNELPNV